MNEAEKCKYNKFMKAADTDAAANGFKSIL